MTCDRITMIYDIKLKAPACVLLQAAGQCNWTSLAELFPTQYWLVTPTPGMQKISGTREEWKKAAAITEQIWMGKDPNQHAR